MGHTVMQAGMTAVHERIGLREIVAGSNISKLFDGYLLKPQAEKQPCLG